MSQFFESGHRNGANVSMSAASRRMNHLLRGASVGVVLCLFLALAAASCPPDRAALNLLKSLRATAEHAVAVVKAGMLTTPPSFTPEQEAKAKELYSKYLAADKTAAELIAAGKNLDTSLVSQAVSDLVSFVDSLQKKSP